MKVSIKSDAQAKQVTITLNEIDLEKMKLGSFYQAEKQVQQIVNHIGKELTREILQSRDIADQTIELEHMEVYNVKKYGPHMRGLKGWIAEVGEDNYCHRFGGSSWDIVSTVTRKFHDVSILLLNLDLHDPRLSSLSAPLLDKLPICSFINSDAWENKQVYEIIPHLHTVKLVSLDLDSPVDYDKEDRLPIPLPEQRIRLRAMKEEDYPLNERMYWDNVENFTGGPSFIRVLGPPIWLQCIEEETCECGRLMEYVCSIGYESSEMPNGPINNTPFFRGEGAQYFFLCSNCLKITAIFQST